MKIWIPLEDDPPRVTAQEKGETIEYTWKKGRFVPYIKHYEKPEVEKVRYFYYVSILKSLQDFGCKEVPKFDGPVSLSVMFIFKAKRKKDIGEPKTTKPDIDNMLKLLIDVIGGKKNGLDMFTVGDQQIAELNAYKIYSTQPGIYIEICPIVDVPEIPYMIQEEES